MAKNVLQDPMIFGPVLLAVVVILVMVLSTNKSKKEAAPKVKETQHVAASSDSEPVVSASSGGKKKKRRSNKKKSAGGKSESEVDAVTEEESAAENKAAPKKTSVAAVVNTVKPVVTTEDDDDDSSSDDEDLILAPRIIKSTAAASTTVSKTTVTASQKRQAEDIAPVPTVVSNHYDGWAVVEDKKFRAKMEKKKEAAAAAAVAALAAAHSAAAAKAREEISSDVDEPVSPPAPVIETVTNEIKVDAKKIGLLIGPKGATKIAIQNATATDIEMPRAVKGVEQVGPVVVTIKGPELGVQKASQALNELLTKGYCNLLAPEDFQEGYIAVHPKYLKDIVGKGGAVIKALSSHTGVKIVIPDVLKTPGPDGKVAKVKVGLTGQREKVSLARMLIKDLTKYYHTTVTHPGLVHCELDIPSNYYNVIIGAKGSEIKNIQNSHKVSVYIPDADSANPNVVVVGETDNVIAAQHHIESLILRADERAAQAAAQAAPVVKAPVPETETTAMIGGQVIGATVGGGPGWNTNTAVRKPKAVEEAEEEWVKEFAPNASLSINITSILGDNAKFAPVQPIAAVTGVPGVTMPSTIDKMPAPSSAWNNLSSAWNN